VRVEAQAMCGQPVAPWAVTVFDSGGAIIGNARGIATADDVSYAAHGAGAGVTALTFER